MKWHPIADRLPLMDGPSYETLKEDLRLRGQEEEIVLLPNGEGIDGRNRLRALRELGMEPRTRTLPGTMDDWPAEKIRDLVLSLNLHRRHLTSLQRACLAVPDLPHLKAEAKTRQRMGRQKVAHPGRAVDIAAELYRTNALFIQQVQKLDPAAFEAAKSGVKELPAIKREKIQARKDAARAETRKKIESIPPGEKLEDLVARAAKFPTITLDPPWEYEETEDGSGELGSPDYATMKLVDIAKLPIGQLAAEDCHVYCWTTQRMLEATFGLVRGWGFKPRCLLTWCKPGLGLGSFFRLTSEFVVVGMRGEQGILSHSEGTWFEGKPREARRHSSKPLEFFEKVERCSPGPYLEIFSRCARPGWSSFGEDGFRP